MDTLKRFYVVLCYNNGDTQVMARFFRNILTAENEAKIILNQHKNRIDHFERLKRLGDLRNVREEQDYQYLIDKKEPLIISFEVKEIELPI